MINLIKLKNNNDVNIVNKINDFQSPNSIYIPIVDNVRANDYVYKNSIINGYVSSISGSITGIKKVLINNELVNAVEITNDFKENAKAKIRKKKVNNKEELIECLKVFKLDFIADKITNIDKINNLVISSIDEENYSMKEFLRLANDYSDILGTIDELTNILGLKESTLATKNTNYNSISNVKSIIGTYPNIKVTLVPDKYMISYKDFLCDYLNIPSSETLVLTTNEVYYIYNALKFKYVDSVLITISGNAIAKSLVINTRLGTSLKEIINELIKITIDDYEVYLNGYIKGRRVSSIDDIIITLDTESIVINQKMSDEVTDCIKCGACERICPCHINVLKCYLNNYSHKRCIGCGLCDYVCPANINLKEIVWRDK